MLILFGGRLHPEWRRGVSGGEVVRSTFTVVEIWINNFYLLFDSFFYRALLAHGLHFGSLRLVSISDLCQRGAVVSALILLFCVLVFEEF